MQLTSPHPTLDPYADRRTTTAFERNLLPGFAQWFVDQVERHQPDYIVPAETKGARVLETVLAYARDVLGTPIDVPVLYSTALAYVDPEELRGSRVMIVDDAVRTGSNLRRHRQKVRAYGVQDVYALACIGYAENAASTSAVPCYRLVDSELYREYVWQLTELVVARGLPPEVDHHVFELRLPQRLPLAWERIERALASCGSLSVDAPRCHEEDIVSMTLHFPVLPGVEPHPHGRETWNEGVCKVRLFPDPATDSIHVVPVSFPALNLPADTHESLAPDAALQLIRRWTQREGSIGELLVAEASRRSPEMIFRALSTCTEVELMCGLARVVAAAFAEPGVSLTTQRELFHRLYGQETGERIAAHIDREVCAALEGGRHEAPTDLADECEPAISLDVEVVDATRTIATQLKDLYDEHANSPATDPATRVGRSLTEIVAALGTEDMLLASRSFDFGLAMTTLVPYVEVRTLADRSIEVRRKYRVSEINRGEEAYQDIDDVNQELAEETVALIAHYLRTRSTRYAERPIATRRIGQLVAILRPLVLARRGIVLRVEPSLDEPHVMLRNGPKHVTLEDADASVFALQGGGVVPTTHFDDLYNRDLLRLDLRDYSTEIEGCLSLLLELLDDDQLTEEELDRVLAGWAMSTDARFGLTHVRHALDVALDEIAAPLRLIMRDEPVDGLAAWDGKQARASAAAAHAKLELLSLGWSEAIRGRWEKPSKRERQLLASFAAPAETTVFEFPVALADMTRALSVLVERLATSAARMWDDAQGGVDDAPALVLSACGQIERTLMSMREDDAPPAVPSRPREAVAAAAEALLRIIGILRSFTAATAGAWRGWRGERRLPDDAAQRRGAVLFLDLSKSFDYALRHGVATNFDWKNTGLNLIGQWGKAFGGWEPKDREGDAIWLEFPALGDPALLCAAMVQQHARGFRSTGAASLWWGFRLAIDDGQLQDGDGPNTIGRCLDRAAKLAKVRKEDEDSIERVLITPEVARLCSPALQEHGFFAPFREQVRLEEIDVHGSVFVPLELDAPAVIQALCDRIKGLADTIGGAVAPWPAETAQIDLQAEEEPGSGLAASS